MTVSKLMTRNPAYVTIGTPVNDVKALMVRANVSKLPVLDTAGKVVGLVTRNDLTNAAPSQATTLDMYEISYLLSKLRVEKVMHSPVITVQEDCVIEEAARILADNGISCLPVMKDDLLIGMVTERDVFNAAIEMFGMRHNGVRITFLMAEKQGQLATLCTKIAEAGGNIVALVTGEGDDLRTRRCVFKVSNIDKSIIEKIVKDAGAEVEDVREM